MAILAFNPLLLASSGYDLFFIAIIVCGLFVALSIVDDHQLRRKPLSIAAAVCAVLVSLGAAAMLAASVFSDLSRWAPVL